MSVPEFWTTVGRNQYQLAEPLEAVKRWAAVGTSIGEKSAFARQLHEVLEVCKCVRLVGFAPCRRYELTGAVARMLGGIHDIPSGPLGGELTTVITSTTYDHNLAWHTDSTSWLRPNRWQILTLVTADKDGRAAPTSILPWASVIKKLAHNPDCMEALSRQVYPWREQFSGLPPLEAPIFGPYPRWLRPALSPYVDSNGRFSEVELDMLADAIASNDEYGEVELSKDAILIFDNHAVLHRGPHLSPDGGRTIVRVKVGGATGLDPIFRG